MVYKVLARRTVPTRENVRCTVRVTSKTLVVVQYYFFFFFFCIVDAPNFLSYSFHAYAFAFFTSSKHFVFQGSACLGGFDSASRYTSNRSSTGVF